MLVLVFISVDVAVESIDRHFRLMAEGRRESRPKSSVGHFWYILKFKGRPMFNVLSYTRVVLRASVVAASFPDSGGYGYGGSISVL